MSLKVHSVTQHGGALIYVNNRLKFFERIRHVETKGKGQYVIYRDNFDEPFVIEGGKARGGSRTDWFVDGPGIPSDGIRARSLIDGLNLVNEL